ncbi:preprotein translocase subunit SecG [Candidatus Omnitrophota bacterium]
MYNIAFYLHILVSLLLIITILIQRGRGGGLVEALAGAESLFGTKTSAFLVRSTTILAICFFVTSTGLAFLSKQKGRSVFQTKSVLTQEMPQELPQQAPQAPASPLSGAQAERVPSSLEQTQNKINENIPDGPQPTPDVQ